jgi:hypothetical protein
VIRRIRGGEASCIFRRLQAPRQGLGPASDARIRGQCQAFSIPPEIPESIPRKRP